MQNASSVVVALVRNRFIWF